MNCIIVDDEPLARDILEEFVKKVPFLKLMASCASAFDALDVLKNTHVDLLFLDIQIPGFSGLQFYQALHIKPQVVFTTAYSNYAVEGFEVDATDYLVKPFSFDRFIKAVVKAHELHNIQLDKLGLAKSIKPTEYLFFKDGTKTVRVWLNEILYMECMKDYIKVYLKDKFIMTLMSMQSMVGLLPSDQFIRVHRSFIIPFSKIDSIQRNRIVIGENWIPIGNLYKEAFFEKLK